LRQSKQINIITNNYKIISEQVGNLFHWPDNAINRTFGMPDWDLYMSEENKRVPWTLICPREDDSLDQNKLPQRSFWQIDFTDSVPPKTEVSDSIDYSYQGEWLAQKRRKNRELPCLKLKHPI